MEFRMAGCILATKSSRSCKYQLRQRPRIPSLYKSWQKDRKRDNRAAEGRKRNSNRFILEVETPASLLIQDSNSDSAKVATANYTNRQLLFPDRELPTCK
jgi:hypothetical protein